MSVVSKFRARPGLFSAANIARSMDSFTEMLTVVIAAIMRNLGILSMLIADAVAGGYVLNATLTDTPNKGVTLLAICWSLGTAALLMALWEAVLGKGLRGLPLLPLIAVVAATIVEGFIDMKIVTVIRHGAEAAETTFFVSPKADPMWWLQTILCGLLTSCGELCIVFIRARRRRAAAEERKTDAALAAAADEAMHIARPSTVG